MGQVLSHPISSQNLQRRGNRNFRVGAASMHGFRMSMEDAHVVAPSISERHPETALFGVFDGHAGDQAAQFLSDELLGRVAALSDPMDEEQITRCVLQLDADFCKNVRVREHGSTCTFCIVQPQKGRPGYYDVMAVNVGDSRSLLIHPDGSIQALTEDHKPDHPVEEARIRAAGGVVQMNRVDGQLAMSRAIGDWLYKSNPNLTPELQKVIAVPQITRAVAAPGDVLLICCDGIVEQMTSAEAGKSVRDSLKTQMEEKKTEDLAMACYDLNMLSLSKNSKDNHSAMVIAFDDGTAYQREDEFIAGPFTPYKDSQAFVEAYVADAKKYGVEGERLLELARKTEANMPALPVASPSPPRQMPIAALQQIMTSQPGGAREVLAMLGSMLASASVQEDLQPGENE